MFNRRKKSIYDVALSFAGEDRQVAEALATQLRERGISVFYGRFEEAEPIGKDLSDYLSDLYSEQCKYCVMFVSRSYAKKDWTEMERRADQSPSLRERKEFILPVRLDDTEIKGVLSNVAAFDLRERSTADLAAIICNELGCNDHNVPPDRGLVIELRSSLQSSAALERTLRIHESVLDHAAASEARIVGFERFPHRIHLQADLEAYSRLRIKFLNGELDTSTGVSWTSISAMEGKERAPAPTQVPFAPIVAKRNSGDLRQVVCHLDRIVGFDKEGSDAEAYLGNQMTSDPRRLKVFVTARQKGFYVHSNFQKEGCNSPIKIYSNVALDLFTCFVNLVFMERPEKEQIAEAKQIHRNYAQYLIRKEAIGRRGDEFYAGAMNVFFI